MSRSICARALCALCFAAAGAAQAAPDAALFFGAPSFTGAALSPTGKYLALRMSVDGGRQRLATIDLATNKMTTVASFNDSDIGTFEWISDERLIFDLDDLEEATFDWRWWPGLWAVNWDGSQYRKLVDHDANYLKGDLPSFTERRRLPYNTFMLGQNPRRDSESIYVVTARWGRDEVMHESLIRLNTLTGTYASFDAPADLTGFVLDANGEPRLARSYDKNIMSTWYRDPAKGDAWRVLSREDVFTGTAPEPVDFAPDGSLYVRARNGKDKLALYRYDLATGKPSAQPTLAVDDYDFSGSLVLRAGRIVGVRYAGDTAATAWLDPALQALQERIDAKLPGLSNQVYPPLRPATPWILVVSRSDTQPPIYLIYNTDTGEFGKIGELRPGLRSNEMGRRELVQVRARDGLGIPVWVTHPPAGRKAGPAVVLVHGGPFAHGANWNWEPDAQFLATRGYTVLEPAFRGSTGYGRELFHAGWKQWGLKMQDDIADATRWAIAQGLADPKRICIAGASYGGYATLMGLIKDPDLYRCGVEWLGVADLDLMLKGDWTVADDSTAIWRRYGAPLLVGDPSKDSAQLAATSPVLQAQRLTQPLLMVYGGADRRVPIAHGRRFLDAVRKTNPGVEWLEYPEEGHGWALPKTRIDFWTRVEKFLDKNIGH